MEAESPTSVSFVDAEIDGVVPSSSDTEQAHGIDLAIEYRLEMFGKCTEAIGMVDNGGENPVDTNLEHSSLFVGLV